MEKLAIYHFNCNSFRNKKEELELFLGNIKPDILSLNELKMSQCEANYMLDFTGYYSFFKVRNESKSNPEKGGGVALLIRETLQPYLLNIFDHIDAEIIAVYFDGNFGPCCVASYYNPPHKMMDPSVFFIMDGFAKNFIIFGDLNARLSCFNHHESNANGKILFDTLLNVNAVIINDDTPTFNSYSNDEYYEVLDLIIVSPSLASKPWQFSVVDDNMGSDHFPIGIEFSNCNKNLPNATAEAEKSSSGKIDSLKSNRAY